MIASPTTGPRMPVLKVENLAVAYKIRGGEVEAIQNVSFEIARGETFGVVGESGCGKSTTAWAVVNFLGANGYVKRGSIKSVSYTHLDVYKRQVSTCLLIIS